jgi:hypothetical protein
MGSILCRCSLAAYFVISAACPTSADAEFLQREWVRTYVNSSSKTNEAAFINRAPDGTIIVAGTSQNEAGDGDYEIIKYQPNGDEMWRARYGSANNGDDQLRGIAIDPSGNVIATGTSQTVKFSAMGALLWATPLSGRAVCANSNYVYVAGSSEVDISTVQLQNNSADGHENWRRLIDGAGHNIDIAEALTMDGNGNVYVAGRESLPCQGLFCYKVYGVASYTDAGQQRWHTNTFNYFPATWAAVSSLFIHPNGSLYVFGTYNQGTVAVADLAKVGPEGGLSFTTYFPSEGTKMAMDRRIGSIFVTGRRQAQGTSNVQLATVTVFPEGNDSAQEIWSYAGPNYMTEGMDIAQDSEGNFYIAGQSSNDTNSTLFLAKLTPAGQRIGLDLYNTPTTNSFAAGLTIDASDNVYVTGYSKTPEGGSEFVTIKYSAPPRIAENADGTIHLKFHSSPGGRYSIEATADFFNWRSLITNTADGNGLIQFDDTNTVSVPYRFYRGNANP